MSELIQRAKAHCFKNHMSTDTCLVCKLADEIERLTVANKEYQYPPEHRISQLQAKVQLLEGENKRLTAEFKNLREEYIERQEWGAEQSMAVIKERDARIEHLEAALRDATEFGEVSFLGVNIPFENFNAMKAALKGDT